MENFDRTRSVTRATLVAIAPVVLGRGETLLAGVDLPAQGFKVTERAETDAALHVVLSR